MEIDDRFPTKLPSVLDAPEPFRSALADSISSQESIRFLIHAPAFSTPGERTSATVLAVTDKGWLIVSETEDGGAHVEKSDFGDYTFGAIITYFPVVRLEDFHVGHEERFGVLELRVQARHGGEKFEIIFPADREKTVSKTMEQVLIHAAP